MQILSEKWQPNIKALTLIEEIRKVLIHPELDNPAAAEIAEEYKSDIAKFTATATEFCMKYAKWSEVMLDGSCLCQSGRLFNIKASKFEYFFLSLVFWMVTHELLDASECCGSLVSRKSCKYSTPENRWTSKDDVCLERDGAGWQQDPYDQPLFGISHNRKRVQVSEICFIQLQTTYLGPLEQLLAWFPLLTTFHCLLSANTRSGYIIQTTNSEGTVCLGVIHWSKEKTLGTDSLIIFPLTLSSRSLAFE